MAKALAARLGSFLGRKLFGRKKSERDKQRNNRNVLQELEEKRAEYKNSRLARREEAKLRRLQVSQARYYAKLIPNVLAGLGQASTHRQPGREGQPDKIITTKIRIVPPALIHPDYYMYQIDTRRLPHMVSIAKLKDDTLLETLSYACETQVEAWGNSTQGLWYLVPRVGGLGIIPTKINYDECISMMPARANSWSLPLGVRNNKKLVWMDIKQKPHILIAGSTGSGKTVLLKDIILTLALQNSPQRLRFIIADFKGGADFVKIVKIPHMGTRILSPVQVKKSTLIDIGDDEELVNEHQEDFADYLITEPDDLLPVLKWTSKETNARNKIFSQLQEQNIDVTNINEYNAKYRRKPMPRIVLVLDEFPVAVLEVGRKEATAIKKLVSAITRKGRSAGIHIILGSQVASSNVLDGSISQNIGTRLAGFSTGPQSQVILGSWIANRISNNPGRMAYKSNLEELEIQTPWISPQLASRLVKDIQEKWGENQDEDSTAVSIFRFCLEQREGRFEQDDIHNFFPDDDDISRAVVREIGQDYELKKNEEDNTLGPEIEIDGEAYYLLPAIPGKRPRKLISKQAYQLQQAQTRPMASEGVQNPPVQPVQSQSPSVQEVYEWLLAHNNGRFSIRKLHRQFNERAGRPYFEKMGQENEGKPININGQSYILEAASPGKSRKIVSNVQMYQSPPPNANILQNPPQALNEEKQNVDERETETENETETFDWIKE